MTGAFARDPHTRSDNLSTQIDNWSYTGQFLQIGQPHRRANHRDFHAMSWILIRPAPAPFSRNPSLNSSRISREVAHPLVLDSARGRATERSRIAPSETSRSNKRNAHRAPQRTSDRRCRARRARNTSDDARHLQSSTALPAAKIWLVRHRGDCCQQSYPRYWEAGWSGQYAASHPDRRAKPNSQETPLLFLRAGETGEPRLFKGPADFSKTDLQRLFR